jgi:hypothetical protein
MQRMALSHRNRITVRTSPEVLEALDHALSRLQRAGVRFRGRKVGIEAFVNAALLDFMDLDEGPMRERVVGKIAELEKQLDQAEREDPGRPEDRPIRVEKVIPAERPAKEEPDPALKKKRNGGGGR